MKKIVSVVTVLALTGLLGGCGPALVGGGAVGGYAVAKDKGPVGTYADDSVITSKIKSKYLANTKIRSFNISVATNKGVVTLVGTVPTARMRAHAIRLARHTKGVKSVDASQLVVGSYRK